MNEEDKRKFNETKNKFAQKEFEEKGFPERLKKLNKTYVVLRHEPLHKNRKNYVVSMSLRLWSYIKNNENHLVIFSFKNTKKCDYHIYYIFEIKEHFHFKSGPGDNCQYINCKLTKNGIIEESLPLIEEYLQKRENGLTRYL